MDKDNKQIAVGDLVQIVRPTPCCGSTHRMGFWFTVIAIDDHGGECLYCGKEYAALCAARSAERWCDLRRLRRIPPPEELSITNENESMKEPA